MEHPSLLWLQSKPGWEHHLLSYYYGITSDCSEDDCCSNPGLSEDHHHLSSSILRHHWSTEFGLRSVIIWGFTLFSTSVCWGLCWEADGSWFETQCKQEHGSCYAMKRCYNTFIAMLRFPWARYRTLKCWQPCDELGCLPHMTLKGTKQIKLQWIVVVFFNLAASKTWRNLFFSFGVRMSFVV